MVRFHSANPKVWILGGTACLGVLGSPAIGQEGEPPSAYQLDSYCRQSPAAIAYKDRLREQSLSSDSAWAEYTQVLSEHRQALEQCRQTRWPQIQATWLRLYPCDTQPGVLDQVFDTIINSGYNRVYIEVFYDGTTVLPGNQAAPWPSINPEADLLDLALTAARRRGLSAYAWMFSLNFGYSYSQLPDRQTALARNGEGNTSIFDPFTLNIEDFDAVSGPDQVFVDPFNPQVRQDYLNLLNQVLKRQPDGVLFDYIRYPRGTGEASLAVTVKDLWIYSEAAQQAFKELGLNPLTQAVLERYLQQGYITTQDILTFDQTFAGSAIQWQQPGQTALPATPTPTSTPKPVATTLSADTSTPNPTPLPTPTPTPRAVERQSQLQNQLWDLAVEFAQYGILDYLNTMSDQVNTQQIPSGAVFFPYGNRSVGEGFDSRLQPWHRFDPTSEWHPMAYAKCEDASCVVEEVKTVLDQAPAGTFICPALAGLWGQSLDHRPMLEVQMQMLFQNTPQLTCVSHFAYSWIAPASDRARKMCQAPQVEPRTISNNLF